MRIVNAELPSACHERPNILWQAPATKTKSGAQELRADSVVVADRMCQRRHVCPGTITHLRHRVNERNLGGEERVGSHLHKFRCGEVRAQVGHTGGDLVAVHLTQQFICRVAVRSDDDPIRALGVRHGEPFAEELRVPGEFHLDAFWSKLLAYVAKSSRSPHGNGRLADQQSIAGEVRDETLDCCIDIRDVRRIGVCALRSANADEVDVTKRGGFGHIRGEVQTTGFQRLVEDLGEARLIEGRLPRTELLDLELVDVNADDFESKVRHARRVDCTEVAGADDAQTWLGLFRHGP